MDNQKERFGLITTISMIAGIVIGSGIFFKIVPILKATEGNVFLGVMVFVFASMAIIFGSLTLAELALRSKDNGGLLSYAKDSYGKTMAGVFGWFLNFVYFPTIRCIVAFVAIIYLNMLFELNLSLEMIIVSTLLLLMFITIGNIISAKGSGVFQIIALITKLIPVFLLAIIGFFFSSSVAITHTPYMPSDAVSRGIMISFLAALGPISFSFDGWHISTTVAGEIKNKVRTLPLALTLAPIFILIVYVGFFIGITNLMSPDSIIANGDDYIYIILKDIFGDVGSKFLLFTLVISMIGTTNGVTLGDSRTMAYLGQENLIFKNDLLAKRTEKEKIPVNALIVTTIISAFWLLIHYLTVKFDLLSGSDISEIAIATLYLLLILLYIKVISLKKKGEIKSNIKGYIFPILAIIGSLVIFTGSLQNTYFFLYFSFTIAVLMASYFYLKTRKDT